ncbi:MAG: hypothetical protein AB1782_04485 [Cyanobacteriota bacterium]
MNHRALFFLDNLEFKYFEFNKLITSFWLVKELLVRKWEVYISTANQLSLKNNLPVANVYKTSLTGNSDKINMIKNKQKELVNLNEFNLVCFRPDPPVTIDYINCTYILDYIDQSSTFVINDPTGIRSSNEKFYINQFPGMVPDNVVTMEPAIIKEFLFQYGEIIIKPLNKCFGKGVFYIHKDDKNINTIIETSTNAGQNLVMVQEHLKSIQGVDKRVNIFFGELSEEAIIKKSGEGDFKFNAQKDEYFIKSIVTEREKEICQAIAPKLMIDGLYLTGLDFIDEKIIEINVTSPCFFIKEVNSMFDIKLEEKIIDKVEAHYFSNYTKVSAF